MVRLALLNHLAARSNESLHNSFLRRIHVEFFQWRYLEKLWSRHGSGEYHRLMQSGHWLNNWSDNFVFLEIVFALKLFGNTRRDHKPRIVRLLIFVRFVAVGWRNGRRIFGSFQGQIAVLIP